MMLNVLTIILWRMQ